MEQRWSLKELYPSFESDKFQNDLKRCDHLIEDINNWTAENLNETDNSREKLVTFLNLYIELVKILYLLISYSYLKLSVEAKNKDANRYIEQLEERKSNLTGSEVRFQKWLGSVKDLDSIISSSSLADEHHFYLKEMVEKSQYLLSENEEIVISRMSNTGSKAWTKLQQLLTSTLMVELGDSKRPLSIVRNMAYDKNPEVRKEAYDAELNSYKKIEDSAAASLNSIKGEVITLNNLRGFGSPLAETLFKSRMDRETLETMLSAVKESLPVFHKYYRKKAALLGHSNGLPFYDLFAPLGSSSKEFTYDEAAEFIIKNFRSFSEKLAEYAEKAFEKRWIDSEPREGKRGGAFCYNIHPVGESRILSNFTGRFSDVFTLAHELGHGYHGFCMTEESILNSDYPMPLAETASIFCETIVQNAALKNADKDSAFTILENSISSAGQIIVDIYSRYLFESSLFDMRKGSSVSVKELKKKMLEAQKNAYGNGLDHQFLHPYMWICKSHYYSAGRNFYNFPYTFGLLFGKGLYAKYLQQGEGFVAEYDRLLSATGKNLVTEVAALMDIDIHSKSFWRSSLKLIEKDINKFIDLDS